MAAAAGGRSLMPMLRGTRVHAQPGLVRRHLHRRARRCCADFLAKLCRAPRRGRLSFYSWPMSSIASTASWSLVRPDRSDEPVSVRSSTSQMLDEVKAFLVLSAAAVRWWWMAGGDARYLLVGLGGLCAAAIGITLTSFLRRPEISRGDRGRGDLTGHRARRSRATLAPSGGAGRSAGGAWCCTRYPSWFAFLVARIANRLDTPYLYAYVGAHVLYLGRASLIVLIKLGRPRRVVAPSGESAS